MCSLISIKKMSGKHLPSGETVITDLSRAE